ncbi:MAG: hypothetical protein NZ937_00535 [Armatimonadetes bacterium]|nr:hypothetical protein [Armatimonadota bacterium]
MIFFVKSAMALSLPPFIATVLLLLASLFASKRRLQILSRFLTASAVAFGYATGHRIATGSLLLIPRSVEDWLPLLAFAALMLSLFENLPKISAPIRLFLRLVLSVASILALLIPLANLSLPSKLGWAFGLGLMLAILWTGLDELSEKQTEALLPLSLSVVTAINSTALLISHSAKLSQLSGVLTAVLGTFFLFCLWQRQWSIAKGASGVFTSLLFGINVSGIFYADLPLLSAILIWLATLSGWVRSLPFSRNLTNWLQIALQILISLSLAAFSVGIAVYKNGLPTGGY